MEENKEVVEIKNKIIEAFHSANDVSVVITELFRCEVLDRWNRGEERTVQAVGRINFSKGSISFKFAIEE